MASTTSVDVSSVCRCCLQKKNELINLFKGGGEESNLSYAAIVKNCVGLQINVGDGLPDQICSGCSKDVSKFFDFKKMCLMSDKLLRPAVVLLERLKEVACQTDEYHISPGIAAQNISQTDSEESPSSVQKKLQGLNDDRESTPNNKSENSDDVKKVVIKSTEITAGDEEKGITGNLCEKSRSNKLSPVSTIPPYLKDTSGKQVSSVDTYQAEEKDSKIGKDMVLKTPDLPLSDDSIFTVLDITKDKNTDVIGGNSLEKLSSCNSQLSRDFEDWLDDSEVKEKSGSEITQLSNSSLRETENTDKVQSTADDVVIGGKIIEKDVSKPTTSQFKSISSTENNIEKGEDVLMLSEGKPDEITRSSKENGSENTSATVSSDKSSTSLKYKINIKSIEDLTMERPKMNEILPKNSDITSTEIESALNLKEDLSLGSLLKTSVVKELEGSVRSDEQSLKNKTLGQVITMSLDKSSNKDCKEGQLTEDGIGDDSEGSSHQNADVNISSSSDARKRPRPNEVDNDKMTVEEEHCLDDPNHKKPRVTEPATDDAEGLSKDKINDGNRDLNSQIIEKTIATKVDDISNAGGNNVIKSGDETTKQIDKEEIGLEVADLEQLGNLSDDGLFEDDDSVSNSSGSEYVPGDSPARSDDSPRARRSAPKSKSRVKSHISRFQEQAYNIRECSVVLSDIAHPSSNAFSTTCSVSSFKSSTNDSDVRKEPVEALDQPSTCSAWIKVEPGLENMEEEGVEDSTAAEKTEDKEVVQDVLWPVDANPNETASSPQIQGISAETQSTVAKFVSGRKRFLCPFCAKAFRTKNQMMLHRSQHTGDLPFPCEVCGKRFALRCRLLRHMSVHDASIVCEFCGMDFKTNILLGKHIKAKHTIPSYSHPPVAPPVPPPVNKSGQRFPCRICPKVFSTLNGLKVHKRVHVNTPIKILPPMKEEGPSSEGNASENSCKICGMSFPNPLYLKSHMVCHTIIRPNSGQINSIEGSKHSEKVEENQRIGGNVDKSKIRDEPINVMEPTVVIHESTSSFGEPSFQQQSQQYSTITHNICIVCSQIFQSRSQLLRHQTLIHRSLKCEICAAFFTSTDQLQEHKLTHEPPYDKVGAYKKIHKCVDCGKQFPKRARLLQHMAIHKTVETPVSCEVCKKYFANVEILNIHKRTHENGQGMPGKNDLTCSVCHRVFGKRSRLKRHMLLHESQSFPCTKCTKTFISQELLAEHQVAHNATPAEEVEEGVACTACGRMFSNKARLKQHVVVHTKSGFVSCNNCFKVFANKQVLDMHIQICTSMDDSSTSAHSATSNSASAPHPSTFTSCSSCGKMFPSKELLTEHEKTCVGLTVVKKLDGTWKVLDNDDRSRVGAVSTSPIIKSEPNNEPKVYACKSCNKRFKNYHGLNSHMRFHQESVGIYKCELCNKKFSSRNKLSQHMSSHTAVYRCGICSQAFGMVDELKKHVGQCMASQSGMTANYFFCNGCSEVFNLLEELAQHVKCHADEFPHVCTDCYKVFAHSTQLNRHLTTHVKEETSKYACPVCQKMFGHSAALEKHIIVHTGEKRFQCSYCLQRFSQKSSLKRHKLTQHETKL